MQFIGHLRWLGCLLMVTAISVAAAADDPAEQSQQAGQFFEAKVRPLLAENCYRCHAGRQRKGGLRLDSREGMLQGGESGPAVVPGHPEDSLLIEAINYESFEMPPAGQLKPEQIDILTTWVRAGAVWPHSDVPLRILPEGAAELFSPDELNWWAFQPLAGPEVPQSRGPGLVRNPVDAFLYAAMAERGLTPAGEADPETLVRRLYFDLTGLPPTPAQLEAYLASDAPDRFEQLVDLLLDSPQYGEHWARHWLDLVRYADSDGYRADFLRKDAWRYRDYVIDSFNADKPWDRFVQEQIAGDELFPDSAEAQIATGYLRHGIYEYNNRDVRGQWDLILNEVTDATGDVFLGLGMQCARCHDHKFDPILQKDYFALRAFFEPLQWRDDVIVAADDERSTWERRQQEWEAATKTLQEEIDKITGPYRAQAQRDAITKFPEDIQAIINKEAADRTPYEQQLAELAWRQVIFEYDRLDDRVKGERKEALLALRKQLTEFDHLKPQPLPMAACGGDVHGEAPPTVIPKHGDVVTPDFLTILGQPAPEFPAATSQTTGRRAALARWLTRPDNALTTRVIVNRIWQYHFGRGLAPNSSDLGTLGGPPSHPELLDWLTRQFLSHGMHLKPLHRLIVTSAAWRQSATHPRLDEFQQIDPANRLYWRGATRRLDAEQIRDAILLVTGKLDPAPGGPGVLSDVPRRSIYLRVMRNERDSLLDAFDLPLFFTSTAARDTTTSPIQSLVLFNSQTMLQHAAALASRIPPSDDVPERIADAWTRALGHKPDSHELAATHAFLQQHQAVIDSQRTDPMLAGIPVGRLPYRDGQSILVEPVDHPEQQLLSPSTRNLTSGDFTVEAYFQVRSIYDSGAVRTIVSRWNGSHQSSGWSFGITGRGSRRKPQTLVMQLIGKTADGQLAEAAVFSDQHVALNTPYYAAVSVRLGQGGPGTMTFYLKDLSNDDEPIGVVTAEHAIQEVIASDTPVTVGARPGSASGQFDGLIDDIRISHEALDLASLLFTTEGAVSSTMVYWQFEPSPGLFRDSSGHEHNITPTSVAAQQLGSAELAFVDFCHALLNSSQFLYVD